MTNLRGILAATLVVASVAIISSPGANARTLSAEVVLNAPAQASTSGSAAAPAKPCGGAEHRQLDFWVGEWRVFEAKDNSPVGSSKIEIVMGNCGLKESFDAPQTGAADYIGTSYSSWDRKDGKWHQMYIDNSGSVGLYNGGLDGADMTMTCPAKGGATQKMIFRKQADGSVRQIGMLSTDGGKTWQAGYD